jgi:hypothetical protein
VETGGFDGSGLRGEKLTLGARGRCWLTGRGGVFVDSGLRCAGLGNGGGVAAACALMGGGGGAPAEVVQAAHKGSPGPVATNSPASNGDWQEGHTMFMEVEKF